jgi:hypothetical protein
MLRFVRFGRHVLTPDQRTGANWFGAAFALALGSLVWWLATDNQAGLFSAIAFAILSICVAATFNRETTVTQIKGALTIDGAGRYDVRTGIRFFDHMLELFTRHGGFDLTLKATGDLDVDQHHTVEDVALA